MLVKPTLKIMTTYRVRFLTWKYGAVLLTIAATHITGTAAFDVGEVGTLYLSSVKTAVCYHR